MKPPALIFLFIFKPESFIRESTQESISNSFKTNTQLRDSYPDQILPEERRMEFEDSMRERTVIIRKTIYTAYLYTFSSIVSAILVGLLLTYSIGTPASVTIVALQIIAASILLGATLGLAGWEVQSIDGRTLPEKANKWFFRFQYWLGTLILIVSLIWN